jgi:hypothetical protein
MVSWIKSPDPKLCEDDICSNKKSSGNKDGRKKTFPHFIEPEFLIKT